MYLFYFYIAQLEAPDILGPVGPVHNLLHPFNEQKGPNIKAFIILQIDAHENRTQYNPNVLSSLVAQSVHLSARAPTR